MDRRGQHLDVVWNMPNPLDQRQIWTSSPTQGSAAAAPGRGAAAAARCDQEAAHRSCGQGHWNAAATGPPSRRKVCPPTTEQIRNAPPPPSGLSPATSFGSGEEGTETKGGAGWLTSRVFPSHLGAMRGSATQRRIDNVDLCFPLKSLLGGL